MAISTRLPLTRLVGTQLMRNVNAHVWRIGLCAAMSIAMATGGDAQTLQTNFPITNGVVNAITKSGSTVYLGGTFTYVGTQTGYGASLDPTTGNFDASLPKVNGPVYAVLSDSAGGWYIGGNFTKVGSVARNCIAHIKSDNTVDTWNPNVRDTTAYAASLAVWTIEKHGSLFYIGGKFNKVGDSTRINLAAIDSATGLATSWDPRPDNTVYTIVATDTMVYLGGSFVTFLYANDSLGAGDSQTRAALGSVYTSSNGRKLSLWKPSVSGGTGGIAKVYKAILKDTILYVCGDLSSMGGSTRYGIGAFYVGTGGLTTWRPNVLTGGSSYNKPIYAMAISGDTVFIGGQFIRFYSTSTTRNRLVAVMRTGTGSLLSWNPNISPPTTYDATVYARTLTVVGNTVYVGGSFTSINGSTARANIASVDRATGTVSSWNPTASNVVYAIVSYGSSLYAGGAFSSINGQSRKNLASFDATTGTVSSWNPSPDNTVQTLAVSGSTLFAGGIFGNIGGAALNHLASFDMTTGNLTAGFNQSTDNGAVSAMLVVGDTLYIGGLFSTVGGVTRNCIAAIDIPTGTLKAWNPSAGGAVNSIAISGSTIYAGGGFSTIGAQTRYYLAAISTADTGTAKSWNPIASTDTCNGINSIVISGNILYAGGDFTWIGGQSRNHLAGVDLTSGAILAFDPHVSLTSGSAVTIKSLANYSSTLYVGGVFTTVGATSRSDIAATNTTTGTATSWNPSPNGSVNAIYLDVPNQIVYVGGIFDTMAGQPVTYFGAYTDNSGALPVELTTFTASAKGSTAELHWKTATEADNYGFDVERRMLGGSKASAWAKVGFVHGAGTSASPHDYTFSDRQLSAGRYGYRIRQIDNAGSSKYTQTVEIEVASVPLKFTLSQNYPNPFNPTTMLSFTLPNDGRAVLKVFNLIGEEVATLFDQDAAAGKVYQAQFDATKLSSGIYFSRLEFSGKQLVRKLLLVK